MFGIVVVVSCYVFIFQSRLKKRRKNKRNKWQKVGIEIVDEDDDDDKSDDDGGSDDKDEQDIADVDLINSHALDNQTRAGDANGVR